jgi:hypothetical protein
MPLYTIVMVLLDNLSTISDSGRFIGYRDRHKILEEDHTLPFVSHCTAQPATVLSDNQYFGLFF